MLYRFGGPRVTLELFFGSNISRADIVSSTLIFKFVFVVDKEDEAVEEDDDETVGFARFACEEDEDEDEDDEGAARFLGQCGTMYDSLSIIYGPSILDSGTRRSCRWHLVFHRHGSVLLR
jgi:hypothetical protein